MLSSKEAKPTDSDEIKLNSIQTVAMLILFYFCTTWVLTKRPEKKKHKNTSCSFKYILEAAAHKTTAVLPLISCFTKHPIKTKNKHNQSSGRCKNELINHVLLRTPVYEHTRVC